MMPAPLSNKMEANDDGSFTIRFTPEHAGWYRIDIKVGKIGEEEHIDGSPFQIQVDPLHKVVNSPRFIGILSPPGGQESE
jgi:hypothetical protein